MRTAAQDQAEANWLRVREVASDPRLRTTRKQVLGWIRAGELVAMDISSAGSKRPTYRVEPASVEALVRRRTRGRA